VGLHNTNGGDLAFAKMELCLCVHFGLYRLQLDQANVYQSTRISADNLPFQPTSILIQRRTLASKQCFKLRPNNHGYTNWWLEYVLELVLTTIQIINEL
jgi:hypothetical protein